MWIAFCQNKIVKFLASLKLAVVVILSLTVLMIWGTLTESRHGTEYAQTSVYLSPWFILTEVFLFINILFAALVRLPFKKRLTGFYIIHAGLLITLTGAAITSIYGIDGSLELLPHQSNGRAMINQPYFYSAYHDHDKNQNVQFSKALPKGVTEINKSKSPFATLGNYEIYLERYLPFAIPNHRWEDIPKGYPPTKVLWLELANDNVKQSLQLSNLEYQQLNQKLGPLTLGLLLNLDSDCFLGAISNPRIKYIFQHGKICVPLKEITKREILKKGVAFQLLKADPFKKIRIKERDKEHTFFPKLAIFPVSKNIRIQDDSDASLVSLDPLRQSPQVLFFSDPQMVYGKGLKWKNQPLEVFKPVTLPWMGLNLTLTRQMKDKHSTVEWNYKKPKGGDDKKNRAAWIRVVHRENPGESYHLWIDDQSPKSLPIQGGQKIQFMLGPKVHYLPFQIELDRFKMATNPGTMNAASYESFVKVVSDQKNSDAHIFMNKPLKKAGFTLYQASYFPLETGKGYGSILSVNRDPGRTFKYLGSFMVVGGSTIHFSIRSRKKKKNS